MSFSLPSEELSAWIRLTLEPGLGPAQARLLLAGIGLPQDIYALPSASLAKILPQDLARQLSRPAAATGIVPWGLCQVGPSNANVPSK